MIDGMTLDRDVILQTCPGILLICIANRRCLKTADFTDAALVSKVRITKEQDH